MSYVDTFGGSPVQPSQSSYRAFEISTDTILNWPWANLDTGDVVSDIMDVSATAPSLSLLMPDARYSSKGFSTIINNVGGNLFTVKSNTGVTLGTVAPGSLVLFYLTLNSTQSGTWKSIPFGVGTSDAQAASLAGNGIIAISTTLNTEYTVSTKNSNYTIVANDRASAVTWTGGVGAFTLTAAATLGEGWFVLLVNMGSGALTVSNGSDMIDGVSSLVLNPGENCFLITDGVTNFYTVGLGRSVVFATTRLVKSVAGSTDVTLTSTEAANLLQEYTGALTGSINVIVPTAVASYHVFNNTSGAYTLTVKTAAGTGISVTQGTRSILDCDGTNVVVAQTATVGTVTSVATGTGLTGGPITAAGTISLANTAVTLGSYGVPATPAVSITVDAQGRLTSASNSTLDITQGLSGTLPVSSGGTGAASLTSGAILLGAGTSALTAIAPGTRGNIPQSNGTTFAGAVFFMPGYIYGLNISNNVSDPNNDIDFAIGAASDNTLGYVISSPSSLTKRLDAAWAVGTNQGGLDTGSKTNSTWYYCYTIARSDTGVTDALFSASSTSPTMPANYDRKRRVGAIRTDGSGNIIAFYQIGDRFYWKAPPLDVDTASLSTSPATTTTTIPPLNIVGLYYGIAAVGGGGAVYVYSSLLTAGTPSLTVAPLANFVWESSGALGGGSLDVPTTNSQIIYVSSIAGTSFKLVTKGWIDTRGKDGGI